MLCGKLLIWGSLFVIGRLQDSCSLSTNHVARNGNFGRLPFGHECVLCQRSLCTEFAAFWPFLSDGHLSMLFNDKTSRMILLVETLKWSRSPIQSTSVRHAASSSAQLAVDEKAVTLLEFGSGEYWRRNPVTNRFQPLKIRWQFSKEHDEDHSSVSNSEQGHFLRLMLWNKGRWWLAAESCYKPISISKHTRTVSKEHDQDHPFSSFQKEYFLYRECTIILLQR